jgi:hypothetical protein
VRLAPTIHLTHSTGIIFCCSASGALNGLISVLRLLALLLLPIAHQTYTELIGAVSEDSTESVSAKYTQNPSIGIQEQLSA